MLEARILTVADIVEAMSSHRPYRPALGIKKALDQIRQEKGSLLDSHVVDACLKIFKEGYQIPEDKKNIISCSRVSFLKAPTEIQSPLYLMNRFIRVEHTQLSIIDITV